MMPNEQFLIFWKKIAKRFQMVPNGAKYFLKYKLNIQQNKFQLIISILQIILNYTIN